MNSRRSFSLVITLAILGATTAVACHDSNTEPTENLISKSLPKADAAERSALPETRPVRSSEDPLARFHRDPLDWVGLAHNRALDDYRSELRQPDTKFKHLCGYLVTFLSSDSRIPVGRKFPARQARLAAIAAGLKSSKGCGKQPSTAHLSSTSAGTGSTYSLAAFQTVEANNFIEAATNAINKATDASDLAMRLDSIRAIAQVELSANDYMVVASAISVGQASFEYWEENAIPYTDEVNSVYGSCFARYESFGYLEDDIWNWCVNGVQGPQDAKYQHQPEPRRGVHLVAQSYSARTARHRGSTRNGLAQYHLASTSRMFCGTAYGAGFRMIAGADLEGAFVGGFTGIAGGPQGIVGGAILGGAAGSTVSSAKLAYQAWRCYWNNT